MDSAIEAVLRQYEQRTADEMKRMQELPPAEFTKRIDEFLLAVGPATGQLMNLLIKEAKARTILELGTSHGYSTVWLAEATRATGGKVISVDVHAGKQEYARAALSRAGLAEFADSNSGMRAKPSRRSRDPSTSCCWICGRTSISRASTFSIRSWAAARWWSRTT